MEELNTTLSATSCNLCLQTAERPRMFDLSPLVLHPAKQKPSLSDLNLNKSIASPYLAHVYPHPRKAGRAWSYDRERCCLQLSQPAMKPESDQDWTQRPCSVA